MIGRTDTGVFLSLPREAVEILDWLREGRTVAESQDLYNQRYGEVPDVEDLLTFLQEKGFVRPRTAGAGVAAAASAPAAAAVRYHFANIPVPLARRIFGPTALRSAPSSSPSAWRPPSSIPPCAPTATP